MPGFDTNASVQFLTVPFLPGETVAAGDQVEVGLFGVSRESTARVEILGLSVFFEVLHVPDGGTTTLDLEYWDCMLDGQDLITAAKRFDLTNVTEDRVYDADTMVEAEIANVFGTWIDDLQKGLPRNIVSSNRTIDRILDADSTSDAELADILSTLIEDVERGHGGFFNISNLTTDRSTDISAPPANAEMADLLGTFANDVQPRTNLAASYDLGAGSIREMREIWRGSQVMNPGDTLNAEIASHTDTTAGQGYSFVVEYKVLAS